MTKILHLGYCDIINPKKTCEKCEKEKEYIQYPLCLKCYEEEQRRKGKRKCKKCGKWFTPLQDFHSYCNKCYFDKY